jgi:1-acyl-sn-glycerol-3-phosphate acyltransferase
MKSATRRVDRFDPATAERWLGYVRAVLWPYFRPRVIGTENIPRKGCALIVGCHSGGLPYDAACTLVAIHEATGRFARAIGDEFFGRLKFVEDFLARQGAHVGRRGLVEDLLRRGHLVLLFPGGSKDMERSYLTQRYRVLPHRGWAPGRGGYVKIALRTGSPIIPLAVVGAEEAHVVLTTVPPLARLLGVPYFPVPLFPFPLPVRLYIRFGKPIVLPGSAADAEDQELVDRLNRMVRRRVQRLIDDTRRRRTGILWSAYRDGRLRSVRAR